MDRKEMSAGMTANTRLRWYSGIFLRPVQTIQEIVNARPVGLGIVTLLFTAHLLAVVHWTAGYDPDWTRAEDLRFRLLNAGFLIAVSVMLSLWVIATVVVLTLVPHVVANALGGRGSFTGLLSGLMMSCSVFLLMIIVALPIALVFALRSSPFVQIVIPVRDATMGAVEFITPLWLLILGGIVVRENYRMSAVRAVLTVLLSVPVLLIGSLFAAIVLWLGLFWAAAETGQLL